MHISKLHRRIASRKKQKGFFLLPGSGGNPSIDVGDIGHSLRCRASNSANLRRTPASDGNRNTWTWSGWVKRGVLGTSQNIFGAGITTGGGPGPTYFTSMGFTANNALQVSWGTSGTGGTIAYSTAVFRDPLAHYHIVWRAGSGTVTVWVNNQQVISASISGDGAINSTAVHAIGAAWDTVGLYSYIPFDGYFSRVCFIDGQALTPSSFGYQNTESNAWVAKTQAEVKPVVDTGGTNSFMLDFDDGTNLTTLGYDKSSKGNNWTLNGFSLTAGTTYDWMLDTPSNKFATLNNIYPSAANITNGNLSSGTTAARGTFNSTVFDSQWFVTAGASNVTAGVIDDSGSANTTTVTANKVFAFKMTSAGALSYKNVTNAGSWTSIATGLTGNRWPYGVTAAASWNFGQQPLPEAFDTGFKALCTANLPAVTGAALNPKKHFDILTWAGNDASPRTFSGLQFKPDAIEIKCRSHAHQNIVNDSVRGVTKTLCTSTAAAEATNVNGAVSAYTSDGFATSTGSSGYAEVNLSSRTYVGWARKAGGTAVANTAGSITSQVSANQKAGFSIVSYTGTGANATVGHGLLSTPGLIISKSRNNANADAGYWDVYHKNLTSATYTLFLHTTGAQTSAPTVWNSTPPDSTKYSIGMGSGVNAGSSATYIAYCFAEVPGYSKISSYLGNGSADGPFVFCGFRPKWVLIKRADTTGNWYILDATRSSTNAVDDALYADLPNLESVNEPLVAIDFVSNGFKVRNTNAGLNANGGTYIFYAIAETNFKYANAR